MRYFVFLIAGFLFLLGWIRTSGLTGYNLTPSYKKDILVINSNMSSKVGAVESCYQMGDLKFKKGRTGIRCDIFHKYFPEYSYEVRNLPFGKPQPKDTFTITIPVYTSNRGGVHIYNEKEKRFEPGYEPLPILSWPTFAMLPFTLLVLYYGLRWTWRLWLKKKNPQ